RLFNRLQQRIEGGAGELVYLVDDEHLVAVSHGRKREVVDDDLADGIDASVAGRVDLENVDIAPLRNLETGIADATGIGRRSLHAVQRTRQDPRGRRLARSALTRKHERVRDAAAGDGVAQRTRDRLLSDDIVEPLGTPFSG